MSRPVYFSDEDIEKHRIQDGFWDLSKRQDGLADIGSSTNPDIVDAKAINDENGEIELGEDMNRDVKHYNKHIFKEEPLKDMESTAVFKDPLDVALNKGAIHNNLKLRKKPYLSTETTDELTFTESSTVKSPDLIANNKEIIDEETKERVLDKVIENLVEQNITEITNPEKKLTEELQFKDTIEETKNIPRLTPEEIAARNAEKLANFQSHFFKYIPFVAGALESIFLLCSQRHPYIIPIDNSDSGLINADTIFSSLNDEQKKAINEVHRDCSLLIISKIVGLFIVFFGSLVKLPLLNTVLKTHSVKGLPIRAFMFETYALTIQLIWNIQNDTPKTTWGELPILLLANLIILYFHLITMDSIVRFRIIFLYLIFGIFVFYNRSLTNVFLMPTTIPTMILGSMTQILIVQNMRHIGTISPITLILALICSIGRIMTTFIEIYDDVVRLGSIISFILSFVGIVQMIAFRKNTFKFLTAMRKQNTVYINAEMGDADISSPTSPLSKIYD